MHTRAVERPTGAVRWSLSLRVPRKGDRVSMFKLREPGEDPAYVSPEASDLPTKAVARQRRFLLVTAPFGRFSRALAQALRAQGASCRRVLLNGGDVWDWGLANSVIYRGPRDGWSAWLAEQLTTGGFTDLVTHGDSQSYAVDAIAVGKAMGLNIHVFEEGYFRPHWVTLERNGVNARSALPRDPAYYRAINPAPGIPPIAPVGRVTPPAVRSIFTYHIWSYLGRPLLPHYRSPYPYPAALQFFGHVGRYLRQRFLRAARLRRIEAVFDGGPVFMALLQRPGDSQLTRHSSFTSTRAFIEAVVDSFARHAPAGTRLLFKTHPLDHGLEPHGRHVREAAARAGVSGRVLFADDGHFPTMIARTHAVLTVNSTGGLSALEAGLPTITLGEAVYDMAGLTHQGGLDSFWSNPQAPDRALYEAYAATVMSACQINGAFSTADGIARVAPEAARRMLAVQPAQ
jgi:capsular polysaccharide export protein